MRPTEFEVIAGKPQLPIDVGSEINYAWDWSPALAELGLSVSDYTVEADAGITVVSHSRTGNKVAAKLTPAARGQLLGVTCKVTLSDGQKDAETIWLRTERT